MIKLILLGGLIVTAVYYLSSVWEEKKLIQAKNVVDGLRIEEETVEQEWKQKSIKDRIKNLKRGINE